MFRLLTSSKLAQTALALISVTYTVDDGRDWRSTYRTSGEVNAPNLTCYFHRNYDTGNAACPTDPGIEPKFMDSRQAQVQGLAHVYGACAYGNLSEVSNCTRYNELSDILASGEEAGYFCRRTPTPEFAYRFLEFNLNDTLEAYPTLTDRVITASSGPCSELPEVDKEEIYDLGAINYTFENKTFRGNITIPKQSDAIDSTTYIYWGMDIPQKATVQSCGPRCIWMWAHKSWGMGENSTFYQCPISVSPVINIRTREEISDERAVPDDVARLAASAIGLQGRSNTVDRKWAQFQFYPFG